MAGIPWERRQGPLWGLPQSVYLVMFRPGEAFSGPVGAGWPMWLGFAALVSAIPAALAAALGLAPGIGLWVAAFCLMPINAVIIYAMFWALGRARGGFLGTLRVVAYAQAPILLTVAPVVGMIAFAAWNFVILVIGLARAHQTRWQISLVANIVPVIFAAALSLTGAGALFR